MAGIRGQNYDVKQGKFHLEQTQDGSWMVKVGAKGYPGGTFDTEAEALEYIKGAKKRANEKRRIKANGQ